jgi:hypothetical protein
MKLSMHYQKGKPAKLYDAEGNEYPNPLLQALGGGWEQVDATWDEAFDLITVDGFATSAYLCSSHRCDANFASRQLILIDIDSGMRIEELADDILYQNYGAGYYASPSHTEEAHRFRIMYRTPEPIMSAADCRALMSGLMKYYKAADTNCRDAARLFFGTINCAIKEKTERILAQEIVNWLIEEAAEVVNEVIHDYAPPSDERKKKIIELLCKCGVIEYNDWMNLCWGMKTSGFTFEDFVAVTLATRGVSGPRTSKDAASRWKACPANCKVTIGSVIKYVQDKFGKDCLFDRSDSFNGLNGMKKDYESKYMCRTNYSNGNYSRKEGY